MEIKIQIVKKCVYCAGFAIFLFVLLPQHKEEVLNLGKVVFNTLVVSCPIGNVRYKLDNIYLNETYTKSSKRVFDVKNSWCPEISTDKMNFKGLCNSWQQPIDLLVLITSGTTKKSAERRQLARTTWLNMLNPYGNVRHMFALGLSTNAHENQRIFRETVHFGDILILNFTDTYKNLTLKVMSAMKWIALNCDRIKLVMKTDCDVFINIPKIAKFLSNHDFLLPNTILGQCYTGSIVNRDSSHKYYVPMQEYNSRYYPPYCSGSGYIMSLHTLKNLVKISYFIPKIRMEDAYLGVCAFCLKVKIKAISDFHFEFQDIEDRIKKPEDLFSFLTVHGVPVATLRHLRHS